MTLAEFRKRYPQYNDVPDGELAERLHRKYYFEMSFEEFAQRIGYTPPVSGPIYVQERRSRAGFDLALPCSLLLYAAIISVFIALRPVPPQLSLGMDSTPAMDVFPVYLAVQPVEKDAPLRFSPSDLLRPPLVATHPTSSGLSDEREGAMAETETPKLPQPAAAVGSDPAESQIVSGPDPGEMQGPKAAVQVPVERAPPKSPPKAGRSEVSSGPEPAVPTHAPRAHPPVSKTAALSKSKGTLAGEHPSGKASTTGAPTQEPARRSPKSAAHPTPPRPPAKRQAARAEMKTPKPSRSAAVPSPPAESQIASDRTLTQPKAGSQGTRATDRASRKPSTTSAPTQEAAQRPVIPAGSSNISERESLPEEWIPAPHAIPRDTEGAPRTQTHAATAPPAAAARPAHPVRGGISAEGGKPLFPRPGRVLAAAPTAPIGTSLESHVEPRPGKMLVRLEGPRPWVTESEVEAVSGKIVGGHAARLVLYVNDTSREVVNNEGSFQANVSLQRGLNHIRVVATDWRGAESEDTITVEYITPAVPNGIAITRPRDGHTLTPDVPPVIQVEGQVDSPDVRTVRLVVNGRRIAVPVHDGRFRKALPVAEPVVRLWAELPRKRGPPLRSQALTVRTASRSPSLGFILMDWPQGVVGNGVEVSATWRARPERLDSPVQSVPLKVLGARSNGAPPQVFYIRTLKPGVYTFVLKASEVWASGVRPTLYLPGAGQLNSRNLKSFSLMGTGKVVLARVLLPQGVLWEQDEWFTGQSISADTTTKFRLPDGIVWKEREGNPF